MDTRKFQIGERVCILPGAAGWAGDCVGQTVTLKGWHAGQYQAEYPGIPGSTIFLPERVLGRPGGAGL